ncbi:hypothetical protein YC2023_024500 [Brassica napus]
MGEEKSVNNYDIVYIGDSSNSNDDHSNSDPTIYFRNISLSYFAAEPFEMLTKHNRFKELCLENDNPEAHYIEGILQYFVHKEKRKGLYHLRQASIGEYTNGTYLYGLLLLALEHYPKTMVNLEPRTECHPDNMAQVCKHCYYSKRLTQFVQFAMNQD